MKTYTNKLLNEYRLMVLNGDGEWFVERTFVSTDDGCIEQARTCVPGLAADHWRVERKDVTVVWTAVGWE